MAARAIQLCRRFSTRRLPVKSFRTRHLCRCLATNSAANGAETDTKNTHFGFKTVSEDEKQERVYKVFHNVAEKYDVMNDAMSGGIHRLWKDYFIEKLGPAPGTSLLDVAGGTGDIAFRYIEYIKNTKSVGTIDGFDIEIPNPVEAEGFSDFQSDIDGRGSQESHQESINVTISDINQAMLDMGKKKAEQKGYNTGVSWLQANAEQLPIEDNQFDAYTVAFGIRNMTHIDKVLSEAYRVLKPGGRFMCLEFSQVNNPVLRRVYDEYSFQVIPVIGHVVAGDWDSYQYLVESIRQFPNQDEFARMIRGAGFKAVTFENLMFGVAAIHSGYKL